MLHLSESNVRVNSSAISEKPIIAGKTIKLKREIEVFAKFFNSSGFFDTFDIAGKTTPAIVSLTLDITLNG